MVPIRVEADGVEPPEPVSPDELRRYLQVDPAEPDEAGLVADLLAAARASLETETRRILKPARFRTVLAAWPRDRLVPLPLSPLVAVTRAGIVDAAGGLAPFGAGLLRLGPDPIEAPCLIVGAGAPEPAGASILIEVAAGFGGDGPALPPPLRLAILRLAAARYRHRGDAEPGPDPARLAAPFRRLRL